MEYCFAFEKLEVWQLAKNLVVEIHKLTKTFPKEELFGMVSQMNRAALSVASNIAEGSSRKSSKDKAHFYEISYGSLMELISQLIIARELDFINKDDFGIIRPKFFEISNKLNALHKSQLDK